MKYFALICTLMFTPSAFSLDEPFVLEKILNQKLPSETIVGELLVSTPNDELSNSLLDQWKSIYGPVAVKNIYHETNNKNAIYLFKISADSVKETELAATALEQMLQLDGKTSYAETNKRAYYELNPNDPFFVSTPNYHWGHENIGQDIVGMIGVADKDMDTPLAWDTTTGKSSIVIGLIDQGLAKHIDLEANVYKNPGETGLDAMGFAKETNGVDDDMNGFIDDWRGWDFYDSDNDTFPTYPVPNAGTHATHVAGVAVAVGNNGIGMTGTAWGASIFPCRASSVTGIGLLFSDIISCLDYFANFDEVKIINMSFGSSSFSQALFDAISRANDLNKLVVASAGNGATDSDITPHYPSGFALPNVVSVTAHNNQGTLAAFSNFGSTTVDFASPGDLIIVTGEDTTGVDQYYIASGTSFSSPYVDGVAALLLSVNSKIRPARMIKYFIDTVDPEGYQVVSGGRLNANGAMDKLINGVCGDVNDDGVVGILDAFITAKEVAGLPNPSMVNHHFADVNNNGSIGITDALMIAQSSAGLGVTLTCN